MIKSPLEEDPVEEQKRLQKHIMELEKYEKRINNLHLIEIELESSSFDENIEIRITCPKDAMLHMSEDYIDETIPRTDFFSQLHYVPMEAPSSLGYIDGTGACILKLNKINARQPYILPKLKLYIETPRNNVSLLATISSKNLKEPKEISLPAKIPKTNQYLVYSDEE